LCEFPCNEEAVKTKPRSVEPRPGMQDQDHLQSFIVHVTTSFLQHVFKMQNTVVQECTIHRCSATFLIFMWSWSTH